MGEFITFLRKNKSFVFFSILALILVSISVGAPYLAPNDPLKTNLAQALQGRSAEFPLGTDQLGRSEKLTTEAVHPYTKALLASVFPVKERNAEIEIIKGDPPSPSEIFPGCSFNSRCKKCEAKCLKEKPIIKKIGTNQAKMYLFCVNLCNLWLIN